jgi:hypothetical protein
LTKLPRHTLIAPRAGGQAGRPVTVQGIEGIAIEIGRRSGRGSKLLLLAPLTKTIAIRQTKERERRGYRKEKDRSF